MALVHRVGWDGRFAARNPWFWPLMAAGSRFEQREAWPTRAELEQLYADATAEQGLPALTFADNVRKQDKRVDGRIVVGALYDARITLHGEVPTRERDWHDFFNALCFATFPRSKLALHARQYRLLAARIATDAERLPPARTKEQDALTLFDEGGVALAAEPALAAELLASPAPPCAGACEALVRAKRLRVVPFGHALFEHLVEGLRCPGGCTQIIAVPEPWAPSERLLPELDRALAVRLADPTRLASPRECAQIALADVLL